MLQHPKSRPNLQTHQSEKEVTEVTHADSKSIDILFIQCSAEKHRGGIFTNMLFFVTPLSDHDHHHRPVVQGQA
jgi:hypothetical protein